MRKNRSLEPLAIFQNWIKMWCVNFPVISCHFPVSLTWSDSNVICLCLGKHFASINFLLYYSHCCLWEMWMIEGEVRGPGKFMGPKKAPITFKHTPGREPLDHMGRYFTRRVWRYIFIFLGRAGWDKKIIRIFWDGREGTQFIISI